MTTDPTTTASTTATRVARPTWRRALTNRAFAVHYLQMLAAMIVGMVVLGH